MRQSDHARGACFGTPLLRVSAGDVYVDGLVGHRGDEVVVGSGYTAPIRFPTQLLLFQRIRLFPTA
jgi:hypothetical protein